MTKNDNQPELEDIFNEYVTNSGEPDKAMLTEWVKKNPQYSRELVEFTTDWALMGKLEQSGNEVQIDEQKLITKGMSIIRNILYQIQQEQSQTPRNTINSLKEVGKSLGYNIQALAEQSELSVALIAKLDNRLIEPATVPDEVKENLSKVLQKPYSDIDCYIQQDPWLEAGVDYLSDTKPRLKPRETFFEALKNDRRIKEEWRNRWLALEKN